ncbi:aspartate kinase [Kyrpidia tusciae]|uniref:Aspartokinase n=1 Tax=Kyrpidia tusciae (strain DSM 2912 / NBRC 15312 / T2) TaxID=562970 RepID=D5WUK5_KYRT2|nr:aspartate kinase [Kyrpidia tusciae]ADG05395.1 aspartate kinase [Kyrpidia tusciae DSM 2912]
MARIVMKFGGSSVATAERMVKVAQRVAKTKAEGHQVAVVVSAMGDTTDDLIALAKQVNERPPARELDMLLSTGEQVSIAVLTMALQGLGVPATSLTGGQAGFRVEQVFGKARILEVRPDRVDALLRDGHVAVVAGFQGVTDDGEIATLGRGGSDTTAVALAAALKADVCEIYTDVDGVYTTDPRIVKEAAKIPEISYDEMLELANLGAVVLHPRAVEYAKLYRVPLVVRSSFHDGPGTWVKEEANVEQGQVVRGIAHDLNVAKVSLVGVPNRQDSLGKVFHALAEENVNVDIIVQSIVHNDVHDISFTVCRDDLPVTLRVLEDLRVALGAGEIVTEEDLAKVSIVGAGMISNPGVAARMFDALIEAGMSIRMVSTSEIKVSCVVDARDVKRAVQVLHQAFELSASAEERVNPVKA